MRTHGISYATEVTIKARVAEGIPVCAAERRREMNADLAMVRLLAYYGRELIPYLRPEMRGR